MPPRPAEPDLPPGLLRAFPLIVFDWDGTAVADRTADASTLRQAMVDLLTLDVCLVIVTGTHAGHIVSQLHLDQQPMAGCRHLYLATNRGSEIFGCDAGGALVPLYRRTATLAENRALDQTVGDLQAAVAADCGLSTAVIANRLNRRKLDLIPIPAWADPPKADALALLAAVTDRLREAGSCDLPGLIARAETIGKAAGLADPRITSDIKHLEIGLTDKADSMGWIIDTLAGTLGLPVSEILVVGDEFGGYGSVRGSDAWLMIPAATGATVVSVGPEPGTLPTGVIHLGGGPDRFVALLTDQAAWSGRQRNGVPAIFMPTFDPTWTLTTDGYDLAAEHDLESRYAVLNGYAGSRAARFDTGGVRRPATLVAGVYAPGPTGLAELVVMPDWLKTTVTSGDGPLSLLAGTVLAHRRWLDLQRGIQGRVWRHRTHDNRILRIYEARWLSLADRHAFWQQLFIVPENVSGPLTVRLAVDGRVRQLAGTRLLADPHVTTAPVPLLSLRTSDGRHRVAAAMRVQTSSGACTVSVSGDEAQLAAVWQCDALLGHGYGFARQVAMRVTTGPSAASAAMADLARPVGADPLSDHVTAWEARWRDADVTIEGDPGAQRALRLAIYHLIGSSNPDDPTVSVPARGLSGQGYLGHVFWDTEIYMLPFFLHTHPPAALALLRYRHHTLPAARQRAAAIGCRGALYAWESADTGDDETPTESVGLDGRIMTIRTGALAHHISADVAYAVWQYWQFTGDDAFWVTAGAEMVVEIARFWTSRVTRDPSGQAHIRHVIGPDEYHVDVDDNAYTNVMAQWVLERAGDTVTWMTRQAPDAWRDLAARLDWQPKELADWANVAQALVTGYDPQTHRFEQFQGYMGLTAPPADLHAAAQATARIGNEPVTATQMIKQADVVMLLHLLWERFTPAEREANFRYYEPRTLHGSSLSPGTHALVAARLGDPAKAWSYYRITAGMDLEGEAGHVAFGVHAAAMGGLWQATVFGFGGVTPTPTGVSLDPRLPSAWTALAFPFFCHGARLAIRITAAVLTVRLVDGLPMAVGLRGQPQRRLDAGGLTAEWDGEAWRWQT